MRLARPCEVQGRIRRSMSIYRPMGTYEESLMSAIPIARRAILAGGILMALGTVPTVSRGSMKPLVTVYKEPT